MFSVSLLDIENASVLSKEMASCVVLPGEEGEVSILDFHQSIISCLKNGVIRIDNRKPIHIKRGIAMTRGTELSILVEIERGNP